jgi:hypothetical protein
MLNIKNCKTGRPMHKLEPRWEGPCAALRVSSHAVTMRIPVHMKIFNTLHVSMVRPYHDNSVPGQSETNDDVRANRSWEVVRTDEGVEMEEWHFENVMDFGKANNGRWKYLGKWEGYDELTWQPVGDLRGCDDAIQEFHDANPNKPGPPTWVVRRNKARKRQESRVCSMHFFARRERELVWSEGSVTGKAVTYIMVRITIR